MLSTPGGHLTASRVCACRSTWKLYINTTTTEIRDFGGGGGGGGGLLNLSFLAVLVHCCSCILCTL